MKLKEKRLSQKLTQDDVAEAIGVQRSTVAMWESGKSVPRTELLPKIAKLYSCTVDELFDGNDEGKRSSLNVATAC